MHHHNIEHKPHWYAVIAIFIASIILLAWSFGKIEKNIQNQTEQIIRGQVIKILSERDIDKNDIVFIGAEKEQKLLVEIIINDVPKTITATNSYSAVKAGEKVMLSASSLEGTDESFMIIDFDRARGLTWLTVFFVLLVFFVTGKKGLNALIGLLFSFAIIISFIFPQILNGRNPITVGITGAILILIVALYVSYGFNKKSLSALLGVTAALIFVSLLANFTVNALHFTGFAGEESGFVKIESKNVINMVGLLIAGIIIAAIGVLDDIAVTQASTVFELHETNPSLGNWELFTKSMKVGRDHISAVINTLVLAYTGASLPLLLLFFLRPLPMTYNISNELIAEEIVRTLVSSSGLVIAVPLTTIIAVWFVKRESYKKLKPLQ